jgi:hypothetical protein
MALREQPYLPLYIQDFTTDEKLMECSALAHGVYIRIMCILHKSETYGTFLLKQKDKQSEDQIKNFATKFARFLPFDLLTIISGLTELLNEKCLHIEGDLLYQKRMKKDGEVSIKRSNSGTLGGNKTKEKYKNFAIANVQANVQANSEYENENEIEIEYDNKSIKQANSKVKKIQMPEISEMLNFAKTEIEKLGHDFSKFEYPVKSKIETWQENGWKDGHNKPIKNWKAKIKNTIPFLKPMAAPQKQILEKGLEEARANFTPSEYVPRNIEKELEIARNNFVPTQYAEE